MQTSYTMSKVRPAMRWRKAVWTNATTRSWSAYSVTNNAPVTVSGTRIVGKNLPAWKEIIRSGGNATTSMTATSYNFVYEKIGRIAIDIPYTGNGSNAGYEEDGPDGVDPPAIVLPHEDRFSPYIAISYEAFLKKAHKQLTSFEGLTFLGELREAIHMIHRPLSGMRILLENYRRDSMRAVRRGPGRKDAKALANLWLELAYGWGPLAADLKDGKEALEKLSGRTLFKYLKKNLEVDVPVSQSRSTYNNGWYTMERVVVKNYKARVLHRGVVTRTQSSLSAGFEAFGLTLPEFIPTAWELIPYSFLIDYFTNVGEVAGAAGLILTGNLSWVSRTVVIEAETIETKSVISVDSGGSLRDNEATKLRTTSKSLVRTPDIPVTLPGFRYSGLSELLGDVGKELNLLALLVGKF